MNCTNIWFDLFWKKKYFKTNRNTTGHAVKKRNFGTESKVDLTNISILFYSTESFWYEYNSYSVNFWKNLLLKRKIQKIPWFKKHKKILSSIQLPDIYYLCTQNLHEYQ